MPALNITPHQEAAKKKTILSKKLKEDLDAKSSKKFLNQKENAKTTSSASRTKRNG